MIKSAATEGVAVGASVGTSSGAVGDEVCIIVSLADGEAEGASVGAKVTSSGPAGEDAATSTEGAAVGDSVVLLLPSLLVGAAVAADSDPVVSSVGAAVGDDVVSSSVGVAVGASVLASVGCAVGASVKTSVVGARVSTTGFCVVSSGKVILGADVGDSVPTVAATVGASVCLTETVGELVVIASAGAGEGARVIVSGIPIGSTGVGAGVSSRLLVKILVISS